MRAERAKIFDLILGFLSFLGQIFEYFRRSSKIKMLERGDPMVFFFDSLKSEGPKGPEGPPVSGYSNGANYREHLHTLPGVSLPGFYMFQRRNPSEIF